jgi:pimeloyl-ACP methyl ester carboxylesterase
MAILDVPGASLYYETTGTGPLLVLIPGANGEADVFKPLAENLSSRYTVVTYDRRGFSRSLLRGAQDYQRRLATDAADVKSLIDHLSPGSDPAIIFGSSSGAIVALTVLQEYPSSVRKVIPHEPPALKALPDSGESWRPVLREIYDTYRARGVPPAMERFAAAVADGAEAEMMPRAVDPANGGFVPLNIMYWFERELLVYPEVDLDMEVLAGRRDKLVLAKGREVRSHSFLERVVHALVGRLQAKVLDLPGPHLGYLFQPEEFASELLEGLDV